MVHESIHLLQQPFDALLPGGDIALAHAGSLVEQPSGICTYELFVVELVELGSRRADFTRPTDAREVSHDFQSRIFEHTVKRSLVARTEQEIWENMYDVDPQTPGLIGYWKFDEGEGNVIHDWTGNGNDGVAEFDLEWPSGIEVPQLNKE